MYKWHLQSAVSRNRPVANDLKIAADGIAASLRQFHISASRTAEEPKAPKFRIKRTASTATATAELSSLKPSTPRALDARSLAAAPPPFLRITREVVDDRRQPQGGRGGGGFTPRGREGFASGGRGGFTPRGRGGFGGRGRGGGGDRGRGRGGARGGRKRTMKKEWSEDEWADVPLSVMEKAYVDGRDMGVLAAARLGNTTMQSLEIHMPAMVTNSTPALVETIRDHVRKLTGQHGNQLLDGDEHGRQYLHGQGTLFVNDEELKSALGPRYHAGSPREYKPVEENEREAIMKGLVAGQYPNVSPAMANDTLGAVEATSNKNPTYLPQDTAALKAKVQALLPASKPKTGAPKRAGARA